MPSKLIHIRLDEEVVSKLKLAAKQQRRSMQAVVSNLLSTAADEDVALKDCQFGLTIFEDRDSTELASRLLQLTSDCNDFFAFGLNLLDFLRESGWGHSVLRAALESDKSMCRLALEDSEMHSFQQRIQLTHQFSVSNGSADFTKSAKLHSAKEAKMRLLGLRDENPSKIRIRKLGLYPVVRWAICVDGHIIYEPHCYRMHSSEGVVEEKLPVFEVQVGSPAHQRLNEHIDCVWNLGGEF